MLGMPIRTFKMKADQSGPWAGLTKMRERTDPGKICTGGQVCPRAGVVVAPAGLRVRLASDGNRCRPRPRHDPRRSKRDMRAGACRCRGAPRSRGRCRPPPRRPPGERRPSDKYAGRRMIVQESAPTRKGAKPTARQPASQAASAVPAGAVPIRAAGRRITGSLASRSPVPGGASGSAAGSAAARAARRH